MPMRSRILLLAVCLCAPLGCNRSEDRPSPPSPARADEPAAPVEQENWERPPAAPFVVTIAGPERVAPQTEVELKVTIKRSPAVEMPLRMKLNLPAGVSLVRGKMEEVIEPGSDTTVRTVVVRVGDQMPGAPLEVSVDGGGPGFGAHSTRRYRWGQPEPKLPQPGAVRPTRINGHNIGEPIPISR
jgi:hypothetical protein